MKSVIAVLVAIVVGFGAGYYVLSKKHSEKAGHQAASESDWQNEKAFLEQALAEAKKRKEIEEELEKLKTPKPESAVLIGMGGSRALLTVGTGKPSRATPAQAPGFNPAPQPSAPAVSEPAKKLPSSDGK